jgi:hypothetical protein
LFPVESKISVGISTFSGNKADIHKKNYFQVLSLPFQNQVNNSGLKKSIEAYGQNKSVYP